MIRPPPPPLWSFLCSPSLSVLGLTLIPWSVLLSNQFGLCNAMRLVGVFRGCFHLTKNEATRFQSTSQPYSCFSFLERGVSMSISIVWALLCANLAFIVFPMDHSFDCLHASFTFIHTTLVTQALLGVHPKVPSHYRVARDIKYIRIDTLEIEG